MKLMNLFAEMGWRCRHRGQMYAQRGEGEAGMDGERSLDIYTLSGVKQTAGEKVLCSAGSSVCCSVMT